nr:ribosome maturation factor RimP [uncultured Fretibacterium sp.]
MCRMESLERPIRELVERLGYECVHVGVGTDSAQRRVRVLIDSLGGIAVSDCETVSRAVNRFLDENDIPELEGRYYLEVSSPGVERPLFTPEHYARFRGREARIRFTEPMGGRKGLTGEILSADEDSVVLFVPDEEREIAVPFGNIRSGSLVFRGFEPQAPKKHKKGGRSGSDGGRRAGEDNGKHREEEL